ncbi:unnamed protein product [Strongylus vulgaris]|uniref:Uncharacterized protein n=1 Tax=Strongylus vulgaris TaxID=40348 RepID=A0A3P7IT34_STRVU|nr:unnamed protein product [Strongylus vulgaris]
MTVTDALRNQIIPILFDLIESKGDDPGMEDRRVEIAAVRAQLCSRFAMFLCLNVLSLAYTPNPSFILLKLQESLFLVVVVLFVVRCGFPQALGTELSAL